MSEDAPTLRVSTYNALATAYLRPQRYPQLDSEKSRDPAARMNLYTSMLEEAPCKYNHDIIFVQECDNYDDIWVPAMEELGYTGAFTQRNEGKQDGCAIFFKEARFRVIAEQSIYYSEDIHYGNGTLNSNVALILVLHDVKTDRKIVVACTHLYWNPAFPEIKTAQVACLRRAISALAATHETKTMIIGTDMNSLPRSDPYTLMCYEGVPIGPRTDDNNKTEEQIQKTDRIHELLKKDVLSSASGMFFDTRTAILGLKKDRPITHWSPGFNGTLDYIFYHSDSELEPVSTSLYPFSDDWADEAQGNLPIPNDKWPSDHIPVNVEFVYKSSK